MDRHDLCRICFPARPRLIRLGKHQRTLVRRALATRTMSVYPLGKREIEACNALLSRGILVQAPALPGTFRIASEALAIHLRGSVLQHRED